MDAPFSPQLPPASPRMPNTNPATVAYCSQCGGAFGRGTEGFSHCSDHSLASRFKAMVDELRPGWRNQDERRKALERAARALARPRPAARQLTADDYLARLSRYDSTAYLSDDREVARAGMEEREALRQMAKRFDPDLTAWRKAEGARL